MLAINTLHCFRFSSYCPNANDVSMMADSIWICCLARIGNPIVKLMMELLFHFSKRCMGFYLCIYVRVWSLMDIAFYLEMTRDGITTFVSIYEIIMSRLFQITKSSNMPSSLCICDVEGMHERCWSLDIAGYFLSTVSDSHSPNDEHASFNIIHLTPLMLKQGLRGRTWSTPRLLVCRGSCYWHDFLFKSHLTNRKILAWLCQYLSKDEPVFSRHQRD